MVTQIAFGVLFVLLALQRMLELRLSRKNEMKLRAAGGYEAGQGQMLPMVLLHAGWFVASLAEVYWLERHFELTLASLALLTGLIGQVLRYSAIRTLGVRWTVRVMILPAAPPVQTGIYRFMAHPNYLGVILEIFAFPLVHGAYLSSLTFTVLNGIFLYFRIRTEQREIYQPANRLSLAGSSRLPANHTEGYL